MSKQPSANLTSYPAACPACGSKSAMLNSATALPRYPEIVRVDLRCAACRHDWTLYTRHADPPI